MDIFEIEQNVPMFIYGTAWKEDQTKELVKTALEAGFRGIDTANQRKHYHEEGVGKALSEVFNEGLVDREDLFVQTKFTHEKGQDHRMPYDPDDSLETQVRDSFESSLNHLNLERIDSYVLHGPTTRSGLAEADRTVWRTMEELVRTDRLDRIGASNIGPEQLELLLEFAEVRPSFVQNRCFARTAWDRPVRQICDEHDIHYQAFSLLTANKNELRNQAVKKIADRHDKTIPQIIFRFGLEIGMIPLTGTTDPRHMEQDLNCYEFELTDEEARTLEEIGTQ
jgi:diketogulonate reductase-like aldo/keto reductase